MDCATVTFSGHAIRRMFEQALAVAAVERVARDGVVIVSYPDDKPYASALVLGFSGATPLHVVVARDDATRACVIVTVYVPDPSVWEPDWKTRRKGP